jgi:sugar lactone lactonase YvrE
MALDTDGRLWVAAGFNFGKPPVETVKKHKAGVYVIDPNASDAAGALIEFIPVPIDMVTNCCFGGEDRQTLFITAGHQLWSLRTNATGFLRWPQGRDRE